MLSVHMLGVTVQSCLDTWMLKACCCQVGRFFHLEERKSCFTQEVRAGTVTFLTV